MNIAAPKPVPEWARRRTSIAYTLFYLPFKKLFALDDFTPGITFSYAIQFDTVATTPTPAALPLFLSAIGGLGFFGWRRKKAAA